MGKKVGTTMHQARRRCLQAMIAAEDGSIGQAELARIGFPDSLFISDAAAIMAGTQLRRQMLDDGVMRQNYPGNADRRFYITLQGRAELASLSSPVVIIGGGSLQEDSSQHA